MEQSGTSDTSTTINRISQISQNVNAFDKKEDLTQVNPQLYEWLAIVNDKSSTHSISQTEEKSTPSAEKVSSKIRESRKITGENMVDNVDFSDRIEYNKNDLYTATDEFIRDVAREDRHSFSRSLANKTSNITDGETRSITIYCGKNIYFFEADGYMHGVMIKSINSDKKSNNLKARKDFLNGANDSSEIADIWSDIVSIRGERSGNDISPLGNDRAARTNDNISDASSESNRARSAQRSRSNYQIDYDEADGLIRELRKLYGDDNTNIRHSRKIKPNTFVDTDIFDGTAVRKISRTQGQNAKFIANYHGEKVFDRVNVQAAINKIEALNIFTKKQRNALIDHLFEGYNLRLDSAGYEFFSELTYFKIKSRVMQESDFELSIEQEQKLDEQIVDALNEIVASGKDSIKTTLEKSISNNELKKQADYWREEHDKALEQIKIRGRILSLAQKIKDLKIGTYVNASCYKSDIFKHSIEQLARIQFRGNMNSSGTRTIIKNLSEWYNDKENSLYSGTDASSGVAGRFNNDVKDMMDNVGNGEGAFTTFELTQIEKILSYFIGEIETYNTVLKNGKRVEAKPLAESYIEKAKQTREIQIKCGAVRAMVRNKFAIMVSDPATLMRQADGYMNGFFTEMFEEMRQGEITSAVNEMELTREFQQFWQKNKSYRKHYNEGKIEINGKEIPLATAISLYMTYQRKHAQAGLILSGFDILDGDKKITVHSGTDEKLTQKQIRDLSKQRADEIYAKFTDGDKKLISIMERAFEGCRKLKIDVDMALQHFTNVDNSDYYFPIRRSQIAQNVDMFSMFEGDRVSSLSMNKDTVRGAKNALLLEPAHIVFMRHVKATSLYSGLGIFTDNFNRLFNLNIKSIDEVKPLSFEVPTDVKQSFGIKGLNDYIGVQKAVISTLAEEGFFDNSIVVNKDSGMTIEITKDGIKETLGSEMRFEKLPRELKELKLQTLRMLPTLIEKAKLKEDSALNIHNPNSKLKYAYLTQDITIHDGQNNHKYTLTIAIRKSQQKNKFWIHEIRTTKKEQNLISSGDISPQQEYNEVLAPNLIISLDGEFVNRYL